MAKKKPAEPVERGRGRPATGRKRDIRMTFWMSADEQTEIFAAAEKEGMPPTVWGLAAMLAVARMTRK